MFLNEKTHRNTTPRINKSRAPQFNAFVTYVNHLGKLRRGALFSECAESSSSLFSLIADWLVTKDNNAANKETTRQPHDNLSQMRVSDVGLLAIFSINVIESPNAPPDNVKIYLSYLPLTSSSASLYEFRVLRNVS